MDVTFFQNEIKKSLKNLINGDFLLLDLPFHVNIGDLLIWQGELDFFHREIPYRLLGEYNVSTWSWKKLSPEIVILLHGGGNFGDVWRESQDFRMHIIEHYPDNRIVILPQSIYYNNPVLIENDYEVMRKHKNLYVCARDAWSYNFASEKFKGLNLLLVPDMAFYVNFNKFKIEKKNASQKKLLIERSDHEYRSHVMNELTSNIDVGDWPGTIKLSFIIKKAYLFLILIRRLKKKKNVLLNCIALILSFVANIFWCKVIRRLYIQKGINWLLSYECVYSTRLHGILLALLLDKKCVIISNNNGKLENYYATWLKNCSDVSFYV